jgi:hypothetical protein
VIITPQSPSLSWERRLEMNVFCDLMLSILIDWCQHSGETCFDHLRRTLLFFDPEDGYSRFFRILVVIYQATQQQVSKVKLMLILPGKCDIMLYTM